MQLMSLEQCLECRRSSVSIMIYYYVNIERKKFFLQAIPADTEFPLTYVIRRWGIFIVTERDDLGLSPSQSGPTHILWSSFTS